MICKKKYIFFDLDGTLIDSSGPIRYLWEKWSINHSLDPSVVYEYSVGRPAIDTMSHFLGERDTLKDMSLNFVKDELNLANDVVSIPGAIEFTKCIPSGQWAIVTSCSYELACARMAAVNLEPPNILVTSETVQRGKPNPDCYNKAAQLLNTDPNECVVFEDSDAGILSANLANMDVISFRNTSQIAIFNLTDFNNISISSDDSSYLTLEALND